KDGQAIKDIEKVVRARNPYVERILYHVNVQGENAVRTIIKGIKALDVLGLDTIILGRGGGSDEELSAYNDEELVRTVFNARTPMISAVGHEGNWSLTDYVADLRVPTPTQAANEAFPDVMSVLERIEMLRRGIATNMRFGLQKRFERLNTQKAKLDAHDPVKKLKERKDRLAALSDGLSNRMKLVFNGKKNRFEVLAVRLHGLSPTAKLVKGFGYITTGDKPVTTVKDVAPGDELTVRIHDGLIMTEVKKTEETK
ncbi:MAG: exodeoxyribonuclease VII large subunit, partial [Lachnospiraceae bacterium]|nr:exodeoxyribonuclease VII large subunit [Lachnospiraceae bacterium]